MKIKTRVSFVVELDDEAVEAFKRAHDMADGRIYGADFWRSSRKVAQLVRSTLEASAGATLDQELYEGRKQLEDDQAMLDVERDEDDSCPNQGFGTDPCLDEDCPAHGGTNAQVAARLRRDVPAAQRLPHEFAGGSGSKKR